MDPYNPNAFDPNALGPDGLPVGEPSRRPPPQPAAGGESNTGEAVGAAGDAAEVGVEATGLVESVTGAIGDAVSGVVEVAGNVVSGAADAVTGIASGTADVVGGLAEGAGAVVEGAGSGCGGCSAAILILLASVGSAVAAVVR